MATTLCRRSKITCLGAASRCGARRDRRRQPNTMALHILVKHSLPEIDRNVPASQWLLSDDGQRRCGALAAALEAYRPAAVVSSAEPKATETAQRLAAAWGISYHVVPGLHEHRRETVGWLE